MKDSTVMMSSANRTPNMKAPRSQPAMMSSGSGTHEYYRGASHTPDIRQPVTQLRQHILKQGRDDTA